MSQLSTNDKLKERLFHALSNWSELEVHGPSYFNPWDREISYLRNLSQQNPRRVWVLLKYMLNRRRDDKFLSHLAAGPFEDLISAVPNIEAIINEKSDAKYIALLLPFCLSKYGISQRNKTTLDTWRKRLKAFNGLD